MYRDEQPPVRGSLFKTAALVGAVFAVALGVIIGTRLSSDAIAVLVGIFAGVVAGIPTALLLIFVTRRRQEPEPEPYDHRRQMAPPVIVVTPGNAPQSWSPYGYAGGPGTQQLSPAPNQRRFRVMGLDEDDVEPLKGAQESSRWYQ